MFFLIYKFNSTINEMNTSSKLNYDKDFAFTKK